MPESERMIEQFQGSEGVRRLYEAFLRSHLVEGNTAVAEAFVNNCELRECVVDQVFIMQGAHDYDLYMIVSGEVEVWINSRLMATRRDCQHVGEMAMITPGSARSATVRAKTPTVVARISEGTFSALAEKNPRLWRILAMDLAERLRERSKYIHAPNAQPHIFFGCASEGLAPAKAIMAGFDADQYVARLWSDNVFVPGHGTLEDLQGVIQGVDFGVLVCTKDDHVVNIARGVDAMAPRDNVILEIGLCVGALGRNRTFVVKPYGRELKIPSDYHGTTTISYDEGLPLTDAMEPVCDTIRGVIAKEGLR
jgi:CRP/FNR family transcriptional regulator, cyclic AMP receptor protein